MFNKVNTASNKLQFFATEEGYATQENNTADIKYTYQYKDHLGNVRLSYTDTNGNNAIVASEVIEESNYYPFGLKHGGYNKVVSIQNGNSTAQKWKYNDTEYNESFSMNMYEMPLRNYDPALARWTTIDPIVHYSNSTYNGFDNNPVFWADPSGGDVIVNGNGITFDGDDAGSAFNAYIGMMNTGQGQFQLQGVFYDMSGVIELPEVGVSGGGGTLNGLGELIQNHTYKHSPFYQDLRFSQKSSRAFDNFQTTLDVVGAFDPTGLIDAANAIGYLARGQYGNSALAAVSILPFGDVVKVGKLGKKADATYSVYRGLDDAGEIAYVGITRRNPQIRFAEHLNSTGTGKEFLRYEVIKDATNFSRTQARIMEQTIINQYGLQKNGGQLLNKINSISPAKWGKYGIK